MPVERGLIPIEARVRPHHLSDFIIPSEPLIKQGFSMDASGLKTPGGVLVAASSPQEQMVVKGLIREESQEIVDQMRSDGYKVEVYGTLINYGQDTYALPEKGDDDDHWVRFLNQASLEATVEVLYHWLTLPAASNVEVTVYPDDYCVTRVCGFHCQVAAKSSFVNDGPKLKAMYKNLRRRHIPRTVAFDPFKRERASIVMLAGDLRQYLLDQIKIFGRVIHSYH